MQRKYNLNTEPELKIHATQWKLQMSIVGPHQNLTSRMSDVWLFKDDHEWKISKEFGGGSHGLKIPFWHLQAHIKETTKQCKYSRHVPPANRSEKYCCTSLLEQSVRKVLWDLYGDVSMLNSKQQQIHKYYTFNILCKHDHPALEQTTYEWFGDFPLQTEHL